MSYGYGRRSGSLGSSSKGTGAGAGAPGKRTLTEQLQMRRVEQPTPAGGGEQATAEAGSNRVGHDHEGHAPSVDAADQPT